MEEKKTEQTEKKSLKEKIKDAKTKVKTVVGDTLKKYPEVILPVLSGVGTLIGLGLKFAAQMGNGGENCLVDDPVTGEEFKVRHPLKNDEILELGRRMSEGETKGESLNEMGLLRKERRRK